MGKLLKVLLSIIIAVLVIAVAIIAWGHYFRANYEFDAPRSIVRDDGGKTIIAEGKALHDENGDIFEIKGVNFGNLFIAEGWMTVNSVGAKLNEDGSFAKVNEDGIIEEYEEIYQEEMDAILADRFTDEEIEALNDAYFYSYCTEQDFINIKEIGFNTIRLPMYYRNFLSTYDRYRLTDEELCEKINFDTYAFDFEKLDWFLTMADKYDLKVIIDMHGVMGGQSGFEHCGTRDIDFWDNADYIEFMCNLWQRIALHYRDEKPQLAPTILAYDLVNEPTNRNEVGTGPKQWKVMNEMYKAIREVDEEHVISIEGVWFFLSLPSPDKYQWENVLYQYHIYNWDWLGVPNWLYYDFMYAQLSVSDFDVPKFVGEFSFFGDDAAWQEYLDLYDRTGLGWTIWSYKIVSVGWWDTSWGMCVNRMNLENKDVEDPADFQQKLDLRYASYDEIYEAWSNQQTDTTPDVIEEDEGRYGVYRFNDDSQTVRNIKAYFERLNAEKEQ